MYEHHYFVLVEKESVVVKKKKGIKQKSMSKQILKYRNYYIMLLPGLIFVILFLYLPIFYNFIAFKDYKIFLGSLGRSWCGLKNFTKLFRTPDFMRILKNTFALCFLKILIGFPIPIILALLINEVKNIMFKKTIQTIVYLPHFISWVIIATIASTLLSPSDGVINLLLNKLGINSIFFMGDSRYFRGVLVATDIWKEMGWSAIIYLAALSGVPLDLYEAATVDGANKLQKMKYVTFPCILPTIIIMLLLRIGNILNSNFEQVFTMYNSSVYDVADIIDTYVYRVGIIQTQYGFSASAGLFKSIISLVLVVTCNWLTKKAGQESLF